MSSAPASRSAMACSTISASPATPSVFKPMWQWQSTRPGTIQPSPATVSALPTGSYVSRPSTTHRSRRSPSGSTVPRTCKLMGGTLGRAGRPAPRCVPERSEPARELPEDARAQQVGHVQDVLVDRVVGGDAARIVGTELGDGLGQGLVRSE